MFAVLLAVGLFAAVIGSVVRGSQTFFDEVGKTVARIAPQPKADIRSDADLKAVIKALPDGRLRVASIITEQDRVVFTVTADRGGEGGGPAGRRAADLAIRRRRDRA